MAPALGEDQLKKQLQQLDDFEFEHFVADLWEEQGWRTSVEQQSVDAGVDVRATKSDPYPQKQLIQAKRYNDSNKIGGPEIQQYASLKQQEQGVDAAVIVTTSSFTNSARKRAKDLNVKLVDGDDLVSMVDDLDAYDIAGDYVDEHPPTSGSAGNRTTYEEIVNEDKFTVLRTPLADIQFEKGLTPDEADLSKTWRYYAIFVGIFAWTIGTLFSITGSSSAIVEPFWVIGWILTPVSIALDSTSLDTWSLDEWDWWFVTIGSAIPILGIFPTAVYLIHRRAMRIDQANNWENA